MARIRTIKPSFFSHFNLYQAEIESGLPLRVAYAGLWTIADREGRFKWTPPELKLGCLPYDSLDFSSVLDALVRYEFIAKYEVDGRFYGFIPSWSEHQVINSREAQSVIPAPDDECMRMYAHACMEFDMFEQEHAQGEGKGREGKGRERDARGTRLPTDWEMPSQWGNWALNEKPEWDNDRVLLEAAKFKDYWIAKAGAIASKLDWFATWRNWVRNTK